jgi:hypothetical protein
MIEQQVLHVVYVPLQDCRLLLILCKLLVVLMLIQGMLLIRLLLLMSLPQAEPDGYYDDRNSKIRKQIQPIPNRFVG